jgi:hypothetical protein
VKERVEERKGHFSCCLRIRAVKNSKKKISILAALQSGAKERAKEIKQKAAFWGQTKGAMPPYFSR